MTRMNRMTSLALGALLFGAAAPAPAAATSGRWLVLAYEGKITSVDRARITEANLEPALYRPHDAYLVWADPGEEGRASALPGVNSVRALSSAAKVAPTIDAEPSLLSVTSIAHDMRARSTEIGRISRVLRAAASDPAASLMELTVRGGRAEALRIAALPSVLSVGPGTDGVELMDEGTAQIVAGNAPVGGPPSPGYRAFLDAHGLNGEGVTIAIADSGIDDTHPDLAGRVVARTDFTALPDHRDSDGHGTHVSGIASGSGEGVPMGTDPSGFTYGHGIAPAASLVDVGVLGILEETAGIDDFPPFESASRFAVRNGAVGWNASWGSGEGDRAGYTTTARTMDMLTRDADWETPGAQPFILVFAAGNSGSAGLGAPNEAKNHISVGASLSHRAGNIDTIASFSSRGPTNDGRVGPTVVAPGDTIISTRSLVGSVLCNVPPRDARPFAALYGLCSGTSMAAPHVTGSVALITEWWRRTHDGATPSPAMAKALLVNSATDLRTKDIPNRNEGWGRVNLSALFDPTVGRIALDQADTFEEVGQKHTMKVRPIDPSKPMKISLAWSDAPAAPNAAIALVNDLDLRVVAPDENVYLGNRFAAGTSISGGAPDRRDVLENVFLGAPLDGTYTIEIEAFDLPGDGIPYSGDATDQDYALVLTNAELVP